MPSEAHRIVRRRKGPAPDRSATAAGAPPPSAPDQASQPVAPKSPPTAVGVDGDAGPRRRSPTRLQLGTEGERTVRAGRHAGDRAVRIVRPRLSGFRFTAPGYLTVEQEAEPSGRFGRAIRRVRRTLIGAPIRSEHESHERLSKLKGIAAFGTDNISSSAYATEELMRVLAVAGVGALALTMPLTIAVVLLLAIVVASYQQTIRAYPKGGGTYIVSSDNLGVIPGLVAGSSILVDYVLTVAVSVSAGVAALTSAFPALYDNRVLIAVIAIGLIAWGNLRGIRESGTLFAAPAYVYLASMVGLLG
ncbi:MAG: APC family permease, partial [Chloroflexota bacterium]